MMKRQLSTGVDKTRNTEHAGTLPKIPEHTGTWKNNKVFMKKKKNNNSNNKMIFVKINNNVK